MQLKTILNRVQKFKSFVYRSVKFTKIAGALELHIDIAARARSLPICSGCGRKRPWSDTKSAFLPDGDPNVAWYQFVLTAASLVELNTFNSEVSDTTLALYDDAGTVLDQNDDCASPSSFQSCLAFSKLEAGTYLAGIAKFATSFVDLWMVENNELSSDGTTLNITITQIPVSAVPVPAAIWLFGTALIGFVGMSRRISVKS